MCAHHRHDISDRIWENIKEHLPGKGGTVGRPAQDNRLFIDAVLWILRTGAPWRDLPPDLGDWKNTHRRFCRWRDRGVWEKILEIIIVEPDYGWLIIDATHCKVHPDASGAVGVDQAMSRMKGGSIPRYIWPWMRMVCRSKSLLLKVQELTVKRHALSSMGYMLERSLPIVDMTVMRSSRKLSIAVCKRSSHPKGIVRCSVAMINIYIGSDIWSRMLFLHLKKWRDIATRHA